MCKVTYPLSFLFCFCFPVSCHPSTLAPYEFLYLCFSCFPELSCKKNKVVTQPKQCSSNTHGSWMPESAEIKARKIRGRGNVRRFLLQFDHFSKLSKWKESNKVFVHYVTLILNLKRQPLSSLVECQYNLLQTWNFRTTIPLLFPPSETGCY